MKKLVLSIISVAAACSISAEVAQRNFDAGIGNVPLLQSAAVEKSQEAVSDNWVKIGTGAYTDVVISSIARSVPRVLSVEFEQNADNPNIYRIRAPYANWNDYRAEELVSYHPERATPMIIHVVDGRYAWFEEFNTGFYIDTADEYGPIVGEIAVCHAAENLIAVNGITTVINAASSALCNYSDGTMTLGIEHSYPTSSGTVSGANVRIDVAGEPIWKGNHSGAFCVQLPTAKDLNPNMKWHTMEGKAKFTDGFTALFAYKDAAVYPTMEVEIQQNEADPNVYRLVNPFAQWESDYTSYDFAYDSSSNYYITLYTFPELGLVCTDSFYTGLSVKVKETEDASAEDAFDMFGIENQAYYFYKSYAIRFGWYLSDVAEEFSYMFGHFKDGVVTYPANYEDEVSGQTMQYPTFVGWLGYYEDALENNETYATNKTGQFKVVFPGAEDMDSIEEKFISDDGGNGSAEYYNLQGCRVEQPRPGTLVIERRGGKAIKKIYR